jgi:hypothetical protein
MYNVKSIFWILINSCLVILLMFGLIGVGTLIRYNNAIVPSRTITVSGEGKTSIAPDLATITFSVVSQGDKPEEIQKANTTKINKAIAFVKEQGVKAEDIKTTGYNMYPRYKYDKDSGESSISGYELSQSVTVKIRALDKASIIVGGLTSTGINQIGSLEYSVENPEAQRARAREEAFANARQKAMEMSYANGVSLVRVINFSEQAGMYPTPYYGVMEAKSGMGGAVTPDLQPGSEEVKIQVSVTYEIR